MSSQTSAPWDRSGTCDSTSSELAAANPGRQYLFIQNLSDVVIYIRLGDTAAVAGGAGCIYLAAAGGYSEWQGETWVPGTAIQGITASGNSKVITILEA